MDTTNTKRILLVDDDIELCDLLSQFLEATDFTVESVHDGESAIKKLTTQNEVYDAVVLDIMMPRVSGLDVLQQVRRANNVPIIMLTGRGDDIDRIVGLELGADDYLGKPCNPRELAARLNAILRRSATPESVPGDTDALVCFGVELNPRTLEASFKGQSLELTSAEFRTLQVLMERAGETLSKDFLTQKVLNRKLTAHDRSIDVHISRVRQKLTKYTGRDSLIKSVRGIGYQLLADS